MGRPKESFNKKEREKKRKKRKKEKKERREQRKLEKAENKGKSTEENFSYVDENGNLTSTPPDPSKKSKIKAEDIIIGIPPKDKTPVETVRKGKVKFFNEEKGFGFINEDNSNESVFVHINDCEGPLQENDKVTFEVEMGAKGPKAVLVKLDK